MSPTSYQLLHPAMRFRCLCAQVMTLNNNGPQMYTTFCLVQPLDVFPEWERTLGLPTLPTVPDNQPLSSFDPSVPPSDAPDGHRAGFVNIVGSPNVGKSTLMNRLVGERLSIINAKAQTTRHRIMGIVNEPEYQIVYSDTPGVLDPAYKLQEGMMKFVKTALQDADVLLVVTEVQEDSMAHPETLQKIAAMDVPTFVLVNKIDLAQDQSLVEAKLDAWAAQLPRASVVPISALHNFNVDTLLDRIVAQLPVSPPFFPKDELTDKPMRFFVSEIVREKILTHFKQEIPYSCEVVVEAYEDAPKIARIRAEIHVARESQKHIVVGAQGRMIKRVGMDARRDLEGFLGKKVFLDLYVRVDKNWRDDERKLKRFGYMD